MEKAAFIAGLALAAGGVAGTLWGFAGWGFLGLAAGFSLLLGPLVDRSLVRYGSAVAAAVLTVGLLVPLAAKPTRPRADAPVPPPLARSPPSAAGTGPNEDDRRSIFHELVAAGERAKREAAAKHPDRDAGAAVPDAERAARRGEKRVRLATLLEEQYRREIAVRRGVPEESLPAILEEGRAKGWADEVP